MKTRQLSPFGRGADCSGCHWIFLSRVLLDTRKMKIFIVLLTVASVFALCRCAGESSELTADSTEVPVSSSSTESPAASATNKAPSSWSRFFRKILDRPTSVQKHADKNRIILENLSLDRANPEIANVTSVVAFHDEETVAVITYVKETVDNCKLMEVK